MYVIHFFFCVMLICSINTSAALLLPSEVRTSLRSMSYTMSGKKTLIILSARDRDAILHKTCVPRLATYVLNDNHTNTMFEIKSGNATCTPQLVVCKINDTHAYTLMQEFIRKHNTKSQSDLNKTCPLPTINEVMYTFILIVVGVFLLVGSTLLLILLFIAVFAKQLLRCCT